MSARYGPCPPLKSLLQGHFKALPLSNKPAEIPHAELVSSNCQDTFHGPGAQPTPIPTPMLGLEPRALFRLSKCSATETFSSLRWTTHFHSSPRDEEPAWKVLVSVLGLRIANLLHPESPKVPWISMLISLRRLHPHDLSSPKASISMLTHEDLKGRSTFSLQHCVVGWVGECI